MTTTCYPEVIGTPGRDASINIDANLGWNAGAISYALGAADLSVEFSLGPANIGSLAGLAPIGAEAGALNVITHGLLYTGRVLSVVESGSHLIDVPVVLAAATRLRIRRIGGVVTYSTGAWSYVSTTASGGAVRLAAALYAAGDYVDSPVLYGHSRISADSPWGWADSHSQRSLRCASAWGWGGVATLSDGVMSLSLGIDMLAADYDYGFLRLVVGELAVSAQAGFPEVDASGIATSFSVSVAAVSSSVIGGTGGVALDVLLLAADYDYGQGGGEVASIVAIGVDTGEAPTASSYTDGLYLYDRYYFERIVYASIDEMLWFSDALDGIVTLEAMIDDCLVLLDQADATAILIAMIESSLSISDRADTGRSEPLQYASNIATGAVSSYSGFGFDGFCQVGLAAYGWKADGIYRLGDVTGNDEPVRAIVEFAAQDMANNHQKRISSLYLGLRTDGQVFARLEDDDGNLHTYQAINRGDVYRIDPAKGISSRHWRLRIELQGVTGVDLDGIEWVSGNSSRRTLGGKR